MAPRRVTVPLPYCALISAMASSRARLRAAARESSFSASLSSVAEVPPPALLRGARAATAAPRRLPKESSNRSAGKHKREATSNAGAARGTGDKVRAAGAAGQGSRRTGPSYCEASVAPVVGEIRVCWPAISLQSKTPELREGFLLYLIERRNLPPVILHRKCRGGADSE